jgi:hypothetical protein
VIARTSSFAFRDKEQDVREVGRRLEVRAVLEGSVRRSGSRIRVTAQLVDTADGYRSAAYGFQGRFDKTGAILEKLLESAPDSPLVVGCCAGCRALLGDQEGSRRLRAQLLERTAGYVPPLAVAWIHLVIGEPDPCLDWLEKAVEQRDPLIVEFQPKPVYDRLRSHPRFQALLSTMHLAD